MKNTKKMLIFLVALILIFGSFSLAIYSNIDDYDYGEFYSGEIATIAPMASTIPSSVYDIHVGTPSTLPADFFDNMLPGEIRTGKSVYYPGHPGNPDGTAIVRLYVWGQYYIIGDEKKLLGGDQTLTISAPRGDFQIDFLSLSRPYSDYDSTAGIISWVVLEDEIVNPSGPLIIEYHLYLDEVEWRTDFWYTTAGARVEIHFTPGSDNPFYWTKEETRHNAFTLNMSWNNGTGITGGTITDNILEQTFSFGKNSSPDGQTQSQAAAGDWANNCISLGVTYYWHLQWVKGEANRTYYFTIRNFDQDLDGNWRNLVYQVNVSGMGGNVSGSPGGRTIISEEFFRRQFEEGTDYEFEWCPDGSLIYRTDVIAQVMLTDVPPPVGTLAVTKELAGPFYHDNDWNLDSTSSFQAVLTNVYGEFVVLVPRPDVVIAGARVYDFSGFTNSDVLIVPITFSEDVTAVIRNIPAGMGYFLEERFIDNNGNPYSQRILDLIYRYNLITTTIYVDNTLTTAAIQVLDGERTDVIVQNYFAHGIGFLEVFKTMDGFPDDWGITKDDVFYVRIWDVEAENYLFFWDGKADMQPGMPLYVEGASNFWCVGNQELGITSDYPLTMIPVLEIPVTGREFAHLANLWTWGAYEVREVRRIDDTPAGIAAADAAWATFWSTADRVPFSGNWNSTWIDNVWLGDPWNPAWLTNPYSWTNPTGAHWEYVRPVVTDPVWHEDKDWYWGVIYSPENDGKHILYLGDTVTVTVTNRYKFHGGTLILSKELCDNAEDWGISDNTTFYVSLFNHDGDLVVFVPDGTEYRVVGFIAEGGTGTYTVLCPVGSPVPPSNSLTQIPFNANPLTPTVLIEVPSYPYGYNFYYTITEVFPGGEPSGFTSREYFIVDGSSRIPVPAGGFLVPNESITYLTIQNTFVPAFFVIYDGNGNTGGSVADNNPHYEGEMVTVLGQGDLTNDGHTFEGWNTEADGSGTWHQPGTTFTMPDEDVTLYAIWEPLPPDMYTVTYHGNGSSVSLSTTGSDPVDANSPYTAGDTVTVLSLGDLDIPGYRFMGWNTQSNGGGTWHQPGTTFTMPSNNVRLYAQWQVAYTVTYDGNGNTGGTPPVDSERYLGNGTETVTVLGRGDLSKDGHIFLGWIAGQPIDDFFDPGDTFTMPAANVTLYAMWGPPPNVYEYFTVTYHGNGSTGGTAPISEHEVYSPGDTVIVEDVGTLVREGYRFMGWSTNRGGYGNPAITWCFPYETFEMLPRNIRLYAQWERGFVVTYHGNNHTGGDVPVDSSLYLAGETVTVLSHGNLVRTGHTFLHWNTEANGSGTSHHADGPVNPVAVVFAAVFDYAFAVPADTPIYSTFIMPAADVDLHAQWDPEPAVFTVTYDGNGHTGGSVPIDAQEYLEGGSVVIQGYGNLVRNGHSFIGWNTERNGSGDWYQPGDTFTMLGENVTFYAQWDSDGEPTAFTVTYDGNGHTGGSAPIDPQGYLEGESVIIQDRGNLTRSRYSFIGWNTERDGSGDWYQPGDTFTMLRENVTFYAQWRFEGSSGGGGGGTRPGPPVDTDGPERPIPPDVFSPYHEAYLVGYPDGTIRPNSTITRAEVATIIFRLLDDNYRTQIWRQSNPFDDVVSTNWFNNAVSTLTNADIIEGFPDGTFRGNQAITRAEFVTIVSRFIEESSHTGSDLFNDISGHWAREYINSVGHYDWIRGFAGGDFRPNQSITRAEAAAIVNRMLNRLPETSADLLPGMVTWSDNMNTNAWFYLYIQEATNSHDHEMKADGVHERWTELREPRDWTVLERPNSRPQDIL